MESFTPSFWQALAIGFIAGVILCYITLRLTKGSVKKQAQTETELRKAQQALQVQKAELEKHFAESAELLKSLGKDYQRLYQHLAKTSSHLLPEQTAPAFPSLNERIEPSFSNSKNEDDQPKDYSEGSSGILKAEK